MDDAAAWRGVEATGLEKANTVPPDYMVGEVARMAWRSVSSSASGVGCLKQPRPTAVLGTIPVGGRLFVLPCGR